jgi:hypothetical protein
MPSDCFRPRKSSARPPPVRSAELAFWCEFLTCVPALEYLRTLEREMLARRADEGQSRALAELLAAAHAAWVGEDRTSARALSGRLAAALLECDSGRQRMRRARRWVEQPQRIATGNVAADGAPWSEYQRRVQKAHEAQKRAKQRFARANLRLVAVIARRHAHGLRPLGDLIQEGNIGLMMAIERCRTVRVPLHVQDLAGRRMRPALRGAEAPFLAPGGG